MSTCKLVHLFAHSLSHVASSLPSLHKHHNPSRPTDNSARRQSPPRQLPNQQSQQRPTHVFIPPYIVAVSAVSAAPNASSFTLKPTIPESVLRSFTTNYSTHQRFLSSNHPPILHDFQQENILLKEILSKSPVNEYVRKQSCF